jgi:hypothetical protein
VAAVVVAPGAIETRAATAGTGPLVTSLSASTAPRSGRILIAGSGFGSEKGSNTVTIGGVLAPVSRWSDTQITAYAPEAAPLGSDGTVVTVGGASSAAIPVTVTARQATGRVKWRLAVEGSYVDRRPAVGPDGTVVVLDSFGDAYALTPSGGLKWVVPYAGADAPPSIGADGTTYVGSMNTVKAIGPDGTIKWTFTEPSVGQGLIAGPTVGPDGNIYAVTDVFGLGAIALSPSGQLLWSNPGNPIFEERAQEGVEIVFGAAQSSLFFGFDEATQAPQAKLYGFSLAGSQRWAVTAGGGADGVFMQRQRQPETGPDGTVYVTSTGGANGWALYAVNPSSGALKWMYSPYPSNEMSPPSAGPDGNVYFSRSLEYLESVTPAGSSRWTFFDSGLIDNPIVSPQGTTVVAGYSTDFGVSGAARAWNAANGSPLWQVDLPSENAGLHVMESRPRFALDGQTVYFGTGIIGSEAADQYSYLYAVNTAGAGSPPPPTPSPTISVTHTPDGTNAWNRQAPATLSITVGGLLGAPACTERWNGLAPAPLAVSRSSSPYGAAVTGDGTHAVTCTAKNAAGTASSAADTLKLDTNAPALAVTHRRVSGSYTVTVSASDATSGLSAPPVCTDNGRTLRLTAGSSLWTATVKTRTLHSIRCTVSDAAGSSASAVDAF